MSFKKLLLSTVIAGTSLSAFAAGPDISGYFDMAFIAPEQHESYWRQQHVNLLMNHSVDKFKFFAEVEFEDAVDLNVGRTPTGFSNTSSGRLFIERAYGEYAIGQIGSVRLGQLLHASLYYENHYPSIINNYTDPLTRKTIWTYNIKGAEFFGEKAGVIYEAWTGRGPVVAEKGSSSTTNSGVAQTGGHESGTDYGGKVGYHLTGSDLDMKVSVLGASYNFRDGAPKTKAYGAELSLNIGKFQLWSEWAVRGADITAAGSTSTARQMAGYVMGSYSFDLGASGELTPFIMLDEYRKYSETSTLQRGIVGLAYHPVPTITLKMDYSKAVSGKTNNDGSINSKYNGANLDKVAAQFVYFYN